MRAAYLHHQPVNLASVFTSALWLMCAGAGVAGLLLQYPRPPGPVKVIAPVTAEIVNVQITTARTAAMPAATVQPALSIPSPADLPQPVAVANPSALFPLRATSPPRLLHIQQSKFDPTPVQHLVFGSGEGQQPAPEYPREAVVARQEGTVLVEFILDVSGHVTAADVTGPCRWPLLNQAAARTIREQWSFSPGKVRRCDVSIVFKLTQN